jgi:hypothetical protein
MLQPSRAMQCHSEIVGICPLAKRLIDNRRYSLESSSLGRQSERTYADSEAEKPSRVGSTRSA